jgi:hypothetical protein
VRVDELRQRWLTRREEFARLAAHVDGARIVDEFVADLQALESEESNQLLSLRRASELSGYSSEHLARLVRAGTVPNAGRRNKPLIRLRDLPRKPKSKLDKTLNIPYDPNDRDLLSRRGDR